MIYELVKENKKQITLDECTPDKYYGILYKCDRFVLHRSDLNRGEYRWYSIDKGFTIGNCFSEEHKELIGVLKQQIEIGEHIVIADTFDELYQELTRLQKEAK